MKKLEMFIPRRNYFLLTFNGLGFLSKRENIRIYIYIKTRKNFKQEKFKQASPPETYFSLYISFSIFFFNYKRKLRVNKSLVCSNFQLFSPSPLFSFSRIKFPTTPFDLLIFKIIGSMKSRHAAFEMSPSPMGKKIINPRWIFNEKFVERLLSAE